MQLLPLPECLDEEDSAGSYSYSGIFSFINMSCYPEGAFFVMAYDYPVWMVILGRTIAVRFDLDRRVAGSRDE